MGLIWTPQASFGRAARDGRTATTPRQITPSVDIPYSTNRTHRIGNIAFTVTNWGFIGSESRGFRDPCTGVSAESFEFPIHTGLEYLFQGALWIGAVKGKDTVVSVGNDGWIGGAGVHEMYPAAYPEGDIIERTNRASLRAAPNSQCADVMFSEDAVSEQDFIAVYYDTITNAAFVANDPTDGRGHVPLGIEITQESFAWSFDYAKDFVLMNLTLRNISSSVIKKMYMGLYMDHDAAHQGLGWGGAQDDIAGFTHTVPSAAGPEFLDTVNIAWIADNDGDPVSGSYNYASPTGVTGVRVVRAPTEDLKFSFNWWISNGTASLDWGPNKRNTTVEYVSGNLGTPEGDRCKYQVLSNGEFDYNQVEAAVNHQVDGWLPPPANGALMAAGIDTRYLLSFGPFDVPPDSSLPLTIAIVAGADFHTNPESFATFFDPSDPSSFLSRLDITNFARNAQWAGWVYDTPGFDTDDDGFRGHFRVLGEDTAYYTGDGVPDFQGPPPPPAPMLSYETFEGKIVLRWNGEDSETAKDPFSLLPDFEGYRIHMSRTGQLDDFAMLTQRDRIDYIRQRWQAGTSRWVTKDPPFEFDSLATLYDSLSRSQYGHPFHPDSFQVNTIDEALMEITLDEVDPTRLDTNYYRFVWYDANQITDDVLMHRADSLGDNVTGVIRKVYPYARPTDTLYREDTREHFLPFYEYEYAIDGLQLAEPIHLAVTTFDYGNPAAGLSSLSSSPLSNSEEIWPINSADVVNSNRPKPGVYPNPYRLSDDYNDAGWEDPGRIGLDPERARKVTFTNVPEKCTISIWTLDGDLVRMIDHDEEPGSSQATVAVWNLITRNTQAVKTGIYIYSIESVHGTDIGKLVVIK